MGNCMGCLTATQNVRSMYSPNASTATSFGSKTSYNSNSSESKTFFDIPLDSEDDEN